MAEAQRLGMIELVGLTRIFGAPIDRGIDLFGKDRAELARHGCIVAVDNVDLSVPAGEIFVVMGLSGSGKSTLLRCINRLIEPTAGQVFIDGQEITRLHRKELLRLRLEKMGMVFQHFALFPHLSVLDNVAFGLRVRGIPKRLRRKKADECLELVGLGGWGHKMPFQLSGGMKQRVGLARALALDPPILLMDEPFGSLDPLIREEMQRELLRLQRTLRKTVMFITHDLNEAVTLGNRVCIFRSGRKIQEGRPLQIIAEPQDEYVSAFVRDVNILKILQAADALDMTVQTFIEGSEEWATFVSVGNKSNQVSIVVLDPASRPIGVAGPGAGAVYNRDFHRLMPTDVLHHHLTHIANTHLPMVVVDKAGHYIGAITAQSVIRAIISGRRADASHDTALIGNDESRVYAQ